MGHHRPTLGISANPALTQVCELRALLQLYRDLAEEHAAWSQRIHATLFHQGVPSMSHRIGGAEARLALRDGQGIGLSPAGAQAVAVALGRKRTWSPSWLPCAPRSRPSPKPETVKQLVPGLTPLLRPESPS